MWNVLSSVVDKWAVISLVLPKRQRGMHWFNLLVWNYYFGFFHFSYSLLFWIFLQSRTDFFLHNSCFVFSHEIFQRPFVFSTFPPSPLTLYVFLSQPQQHISPQTALRRATPLACSWGKEERRGWVPQPRECCSTLCLSVPLYPAPVYSCKAEGRGTGNAASTSSNSGASAQKEAPADLVTFLGAGCLDRWLFKIILTLKIML